MTRIPPLPKAVSAQQWRAEEEELRSRILNIAYHGWPTDWINSPPRFEQVGVIEF